MKLKIFVLQNGLFVGYTKHYPGSVADLKMCWKKSGFHQESSKTFVDGLNSLDDVLMPDLQGYFWTILVGKEYQESTEQFGVLHLPVCYWFSPLSASGQEDN